MAKYKAAVLALFASATVASAEEITIQNVTLKAAYCVPVAKADIRLAADFLESLKQTARIDPSFRQQRIVDAEHLRIAAEDRLDRLRAYLLPKGDKTDADAMLLAMSRGERDLISEDPAFKACLKRCPEDNLEAHSVCAKPCFANSERGQRLQSCRLLTWLPF